MSRSEPQPKAYRPFQSARKPGGKPDVQPEWRVLVHRKHAAAWSNLVERFGQTNADELWDHLTTSPDRPPRLGTVTPMRGKLGKALNDGTSRVYHYEISGAGRVDYRFHPSFSSAPDREPHPTVFIVSIDHRSH